MIEPQALRLPPLGLYVHIPWCVRKCPYCDFNSHEARQIPEAEYVRALLDDLSQDAQMAQGRRLSSVFFGGGTPSLFSAQSIASVLARAESVLGMEDACEITLEANPGASEYSNLNQLRAAGVNRLSFGVQSFNDGHLQALGRIHGRDEALTAFAQARRAGFDNINLDLMHGLPDQTQAQALADLEQAVRLGPEHLSWYQLTIEPNTAFHKAPPLLPEDDTLAEIQDAGHELLHAAGYQQYEVSAYSRTGRQSRHNLNYWQFGDYLAVGAGGHGKISYPDGRIERYRKTRLPADYLDSTKRYTAACDPIAADKRSLEFLMNSLRLVDGVPRSLFSARTGLEDGELQAGLARAVAQQLLYDRPDRLQPTPLGMRFLNHLLGEFI